MAGSCQQRGNQHGIDGNTKDDAGPDDRASKVGGRGQAF